MEDEASCRRSVAELAGRFKGSAPPHDAAGQNTEKPVRRRPPCSLQLPKTEGNEPEPPGVTSPLPTKAKRNSALIEKLQANLALSPVALMPSPKSPGFRLLPPAFAPPSPSSAQVTTVTASSTPTPTSPVAISPLTEEEGPASFEDPPNVGERSTLSNANIKGRARHSIRRRPPSRRHKKSSEGDEVNVTSEGGDASLHSINDGGGGDKKEAETDEVTEDKTDASKPPDEQKSHEEEEKPEVSITPREEEEKRKNRSPEREEEDRPSSGGKDEEEKTEGEDDVAGRTSKSEDKEEENIQIEDKLSQSSVR